MYHISSFHYLSCRLKKNTYNKSRSAQSQDRPALPFLGLAGPRPEAPRGLESQPRPAPPPKRRGPASGSPRRTPVLDTLVDTTDVGHCVAGNHLTLINSLWFTANYTMAPSTSCLSLKIRTVAAIFWEITWAITVLRPCSDAELPMPTEKLSPKSSLSNRVSNKLCRVVDTFPEFWCLLTLYRALAKQLLLICVRVSW